MKKIIIGTALTSSLVFGCGCIDTGTAMSLSQISLQKYYQQDSEIAQEINKLVDDIKEAHEKYENESSERIIDTKLLLAKQLELQKELLHNVVVINKIQDVINTKKATENTIQIGETK